MIASTLTRSSPRHLWILLVATLVIQGFMFVSYPLDVGNSDDNQAAQAYLMSELADGNLMIGNIRYNTGYPFVMSPFFSWARSLGDVRDRVFLLIQV